MVPLARMQSIGVQQGPLQRLLGLASARVHTVAGPVTPTVPVMSVVDALAFFESLAVSGVRAAGRDASHLWGRRAGGPVTWPAPEGDPYA